MEKRPRIELFVKASYRFCINPLKDEVKNWIFLVFFTIAALVLMWNTLRAMW